MSSKNARQVQEEQVQNPDSRVHLKCSEGGLPRKAVCKHWVSGICYHPNAYKLIFTSIKCEGWTK